MPKISVVMPCRDRGDLISESVQSILDQTEPNFEFIIVDDHSDPSDKTAEVVAAFADPRIKYFKLADQNGMGISAARNFGNAMASAPIITVMDSDDISYPERLEVTLKAFEEEKCDLVYGEIDLWWPEENRVEKRHNEYSSRVFDLEYFKKYNFIPHVSVSYKKDLASNFPYNSFFRKSEDYDLLARLAKNGHRFHFIDKVLVKVRKHNGSVTRKTDDLYDYPNTVRRDMGWEEQA